MKTLIIAVALIIGACGFGYSDPAVWTGQHQPINHIEMMLHGESEQPTSNISINGLANAAVEKSGFAQTTEFIGSGNIAQAIGATK